jgi:hypothetical protein
MSRTGRRSHTSPNGGSSNGRRQPIEPEAWDDLGFPEIPPYYPNRLRNRMILGVVLLVILVAAVAVGVVLSMNGNDNDQAVLVENKTITVNETSDPSSLSALPTHRPTRLTLSPTTERPTDDPTLGLTLPPTDVPTASQDAATLAPTSLRPTSPPTSVSAVPTVVNQFLDGLPPYSIELASTNASSPQAIALDNLQKDPLYNKYQNVHRLYQRYALAVFYLSTNGYSWQNDYRWLSNDNERNWYMDDRALSHCGADSRLTMLNLYENDLEGSIPTEVELLTDLERISLGYFGAARFTGTIPSEM